MRRIRMISILALALITAIAMTGVSVSALSDEMDGSCWYDGSNIVSNFDAKEIADAVTNLQPGDDVTFTVEYTNKDDETTDWYLSNEVLQTLEKANSSKRVAGTGTAENGGYTYSLTHTDKSGKKDVLFDSDKVGGEAKPAGMQGLEQATNALDDWFYIQTLEKGESGTVKLHVAFEGETEVNDYMDTNGEVTLKFAVEPAKAGSGDKHPGKGAKTGDPANLWPWIIAMLIAGLALLALALRNLRKDHETAKTGGDE